MIEQARSAVSDFECEYRLMMPDHSIKYLHAVAHATRDQDGQLEYIARGSGCDGSAGCRKRHSTRLDRSSPTWPGS